jgi:hypothetical protein
MGRLRALLILGWALLVTLLRNALGRRRGLTQFRANYAADGLTRVSTEQREAMASFSGCIACGLCERGEWANRRAPGAGPMSLALAGSRSMPDFAASAATHRTLSVEQLRQRERLCPVAVPLEAIKGFVEDKAPQARVSQPPAAS